MTKQATRQRIRKALLLFSFLLFPITLYYFSPVIIVEGAAEGIVTGSFLVFVAMFLSALLFGRFWCGWFCPAGGLQEFCQSVNDRPARTGKLDWIKWVIWVPWLGISAFAAVQAGGYRQVDPFYHLEGGVTLGQAYWQFIYYIIIAIFVLLPLVFGRRAACHYICWMAPFMIIGRKARNLVKWPALRLKADADQCNDCQRCTRSCPMSIDVNKLVRGGSMEHSECILCGTCRDVCPKDVLQYTFQAGK